jgi:hypothetical protein
MYLVADIVVDVVWGIWVALIVYECGDSVTVSHEDKRYDRYPVGKYSTCRLAKSVFAFVQVTNALGVQQSLTSTKTSC